MEICMRGKEERERSYGPWGRSLPFGCVEVIYQLWAGAGLHPLSLMCPSAWFRPITVKAPTRRHATECPHLPMHLQAGMCTHTCVPSLFAKRKNKTFKRYPADQDKISSFFLLFIWQCHNGACSYFSLPFLFSHSLTLKLNLGFSLLYILCSFSHFEEVDDLLYHCFCLLNTEIGMIKIQYDFLFLFFVGIEQADGIKTASLTSRFNEICKGNCQRLL